MKNRVRGGRGARSGLECGSARVPRGIPFAIHRARRWMSVYRLSGRGGVRGASLAAGGHAGRPKMCAGGEGWESSRAGAEGPSPPRTVGAHSHPPVPPPAPPKLNPDMAVSPLSVTRHSQLRFTRLARDKYGQCAGADGVTMTEYQESGWPNAPEPPGGEGGEAPGLTTASTRLTPSPGECGQGGARKVFIHTFTSSRVVTCSVWTPHRVLSVICGQRRG